MEKGNLISLCRQFNVKNLEIYVCDEFVRVGGLARSFYQKQLVQERLRRATKKQIFNQIEVVYEPKK